jgi:S-DNA-T family DNA segregation ATPase FtsK/SpoIIIE
MFKRAKKRYVIPGGKAYNPFLELANNPHILIAGATGSGKSVTVNGIIATLIMKHSPSECQFVFVDPKKVELSQYRSLPHCIRYASENNDIIAAMQGLVNVMENRYKEMQRQGKRDYSGSDIYLVIDELADIMTTDKKRFMPLLQRIAQLGRAAKVHSIICTQSVLVQILPSVIRCNYPVVVGLRTANSQQSRLLIQTTGCELLPDPKQAGTGYAMIKDGADIYHTEIYRYSDSVIDGLIRYWTGKQCIA